MIDLKRLSRRFVLAFLFISVLVPVVPLLLWSFSFRWVYPNLLPEWSTRGWNYVFSQHTIIDATVTSIVLSTVVTALSLVLGFSTAKALGTREFRGKNVVEMFILLPAIIPVISAVMGMQGIFIRLYLSDSYIGVVLAQLVFTMPYMIMGLSSVFKNYNMEYEQQAYTLGADRWDILFNITIPAIFPGLVVSCLFAFVVSWSQYLLTLVIGGTAVNTLPMVLFALMGSGDYAVACAVSIIFIVPVLVLLIASSRYLISSDPTTRGMTNP